MATHYSIRKHVPAPEIQIPDKLYFRIGDVAKLLEVPAYVLRFWETEFPQLKPNKGGTGQRLYRKKDVEMALRIKSLLYDQGYTIAGARQIFKSEARPAEPIAILTPAAAETPTPLATQSAQHPILGDVARDKRLSAIRSELRALQAILARPVSEAHPPATNKIKPMRPRLVLEPKPEKLKPVLELRQPGLFAFDDDSGPLAG